MQVRWYVGWPVAVALGFGGLRFAASRAAYYPYKYPEGYWEVEHELRAENVWLTTADGVRLHAWWIPSPGSALATLFFHGNAGNITHRSPHIRYITAAGSSVLMLDYRGYGKSEGSPSEQGLFADAETAYAYLRGRGYGARQIVLHGESLGTAVAVDLASKTECAGVVLESAFTSGREVAASAFPFIGALLFRQFDSAGKIAGIRAPFLFLHGSQDDIVPLGLGRALYERASDPKSFWEVPGAGHNDLVEAAGPEYRERLGGFYRSLAP